jgi:hypothetical protein
VSAIQALVRMQSVPLSRLKSAASMAAASHPAA